MKDYYYILGVKRTADLEGIKKAYRKLSHKFHPDKNDGDPFFEERFKDINEAYETLSNPIKRPAYDSQFDTSSERKYQNEQNFEPCIDYFNVNLAEVEYNQEVIFSWKVKNSIEIVLEPFGKVELIGQRKYILKDLKHKTLTFTLIAKNLDKKVERSITILNKAFCGLEGSDNKYAAAKHEHVGNKTNVFRSQVIIGFLAFVILVISFLYLFKSSIPSDIKQTNLDSVSRTQQSSIDPEFIHETKSEETIGGINDFDELFSDRVVIPPNVFFKKMIAQEEGKTNYYIYISRNSNADSITNLIFDLPFKDEPIEFSGTISSKGKLLVSGYDKAKEIKISGYFINDSILTLNLENWEDLKISFLAFKE